LKQIRRHLTYANVMSSIAVFLMLGGATAFAATKIGANEIKANSIKTGKIVKEAVTAGKIKTGAVTESRIADGAVTTNKIADNAVNTNKIANNAVTTTKILNDAVTGDKVKESTLGTVPTATKAAEATKLSNVFVVKVDFTVASGAGNNTTATASCPAGTQGIGGGVRDDAFASTAAIVTSRPTIGEFGLPQTGEGFDGWRGSVTNTAAGVLNSTVWAICAG
jgi:hypothetical protein